MAARRVVVDDAASVRSVLAEVYAALAIDWDPDATGAVAEEAPGATPEAVTAAMLARFAAGHELVDGTLGDATLELAHRLRADHLAGSVGGPAAPG